MTDKEKAELYYKALDTILKRLVAHNATEESTGRLKAYLVGYIEGIFGTVKYEGKP